MICDLTRKTMRERNCDPGRLDRINVDCDPYGGDPLQRVEIEEELYPVRRLLTDLSPLKRYVIDECFVRDRSCAEIARRNGLPAARVRKVKSRALREFRERLHRPRPS